jgi:hypothetical protein
MTKRRHTLLGRVVRDIQRKTTTRDHELTELLQRVGRLLAQQRQDREKLYSVHAPEVECLAKGKVQKRYEFGCKVSVASTSRGNWIVGARALHGNPYDGHPLGDALQQAERLCGQRPQTAFVDLGYRGHGVERRLGDSRRAVAAPASGEEFAAVDESARGDRAGDWTLEVGPSNATEPSEGPPGRSTQRAAERLWVQLAKAPTSLLLSRFVVDVPALAASSLLTALRLKKMVRGFFSVDFIS